MARAMGTLYQTELAGTGLRLKFEATDHDTALEHTVTICGRWPVVGSDRR